MLTTPRTAPARALTLAVLRAVAVTLIAWGAVQIASRLLYGLLGNNNLPSAWNVWNSIGETHGIFRGIPVLALGIALALALLSAPLARWIIRPPAPGCPRCGYNHNNASTPCPECGEPPTAAT